MKKIIASFSGLMVWLVLGAQVSAMCIWFAPPGRMFEPATDIQTLIVKQDNQQKLVVQPQFQGTAKDFALVMPFPSEPGVDEAPGNIFKQLEDLTNPIIEFDDGPIPLTLESDGANQSRSGVEVVEQRDVGDFESTTLRADSAEALTAWLRDNNYEISEEKLETLQFYVDKGTAYFVALKINMGKADVDSNGLLKGQLDPLLFSFSSQMLELPLRLMASSSEQIFDLVIYTLSDQQYYVPGAEVQFARKLVSGDLEEVKSLQQFEPQSKWLTRNSISLNSSKIEKDMSFYSTPQDVVVDVGDESVRINPDLLDPRTGLIEADNGKIIYSEEGKSSYGQQTGDSGDNQDRALIVVTVLLGMSNILLLNTVLKQRTELAQKQNGKK